MNKTKEELRKEFYKGLESHLDKAAESDTGTDKLMDFVFDFFYTIIHEKERIHVQLATDYKNQEEQNDSFRKKIQSLEQLLKAADEVIRLKNEYPSTKNLIDYRKAVESYTTLKQQMK